MCRVLSSTHSLGESLVRTGSPEIRLIRIKSCGQLVGEAQHPGNIQKRLETNPEISVLDLAEGVAANVGSVCHLLSRKAKEFAPG